MSKIKKSQPPLIIGWRETLCLPQLNIENIKAKIDTGACSSCLHAFDVKIIEINGQSKVHFKVHPYQKDSKNTIIVETDLFGTRKVKSSNGQTQIRPVIKTDVKLGEQVWSIEITLTNRDLMSFRMLLGRQAIRKRFLVDSGKSFLQSVNKKK